jgi:hypothetical protein
VDKLDQLHDRRRPIWQASGHTALQLRGIPCVTRRGYLSRRCQAIWTSGRHDMPRSYPSINLPTTGKSIGYYPFPIVLPRTIITLLGRLVRGDRLPGSRSDQRINRHEEVTISLSNVATEGIELCKTPHLLVASPHSGHLDH